MKKFKLEIEYSHKDDGHRSVTLLTRVDVDNYPDSIVERLEAVRMEFWRNIYTHMENAGVVDVWRVYSITLKNITLID